MIRQSITVAVLFLLLAGVNACGRPGCNGVAYTPIVNAPFITRVELLDQLPKDPWTLIFALEFTDANGDVGAGRAEFFLNGSPTPTKLNLADDFQQSQVPENATQGRVAIPLRFGDNIQDASVVRLGVQLVDAASLRSNCYAMDLGFSVKPVSLLHEEKPWRLATYVFDLLWKRS